LTPPRRQTRPCASIQNSTRPPASPSLDYGEDVRMMLPRILVGEQRDPGLTPCLQRLLGGNDEAASKAAGERRGRVVELMALDQLDKEVARSPICRPRSAAGTPMRNFSDFSEALRGPPQGSVLAVRTRRPNGQDATQATEVVSLAGRRGSCCQVVELHIVLYRRVQV